MLAVVPKILSDPCFRQRIDEREAWMLDGDWTIERAGYDAGRPAESAQRCGSGYGSRNFRSSEGRPDDS